MEDRRFKIARFEALCSVSLALLYLLWWYGFAYHGTPEDPSSFNFVMGLPGWFFFSSVLGPFTFCVLAWVMVKVLFRPVSLDSREDEQSE